MLLVFYVKVIWILQMTWLAYEKLIMQYKIINKFIILLE